MGYRKLANICQIHANSQAKQIYFKNCFLHKLFGKMTSPHTVFFQFQICKTNWPSLLCMYVHIGCLGPVGLLRACLMRACLLRAYLMRAWPRIPSPVRLVPLPSSQNNYVSTHCSKGVLDFPRYNTTFL